MSFGWVEVSKGAIDTNRSGLHELFQPGELETARVVRLATTFGLRRSGVADLRWRCTDLGLDRAGIGGGESQYRRGQRIGWGGSGDGEVEHLGLSNRRVEKDDWRFRGD